MTVIGFDTWKAAEESKVATIPAMAAWLFGVLYRQAMIGFASPHHGPGEASWQNG